MQSVNLTDQEILENRRKAITFLKDPARKKATGYLDKGDERRCCLGHMCVALGIVSQASAPYQKCAFTYGTSNDTGVAPKELVRELGMFNPSGFAKVPESTVILLRGRRKKRLYSLTDMNDHSMMTPQEIGEYLESVIIGGDETPWKKIRIPVAERKH